MEIKQTTIAKIITFKFGIPAPAAEIAAEEMVKDDFPKNGIRTMGQAIGYLEHVRSLLKARRGA